MELQCLIRLFAELIVIVFNGAQLQAGWNNITSIHVPLFFVAAYLSVFGDD